MILADAHFHLFRNGYPGVYGRSLIAGEIDIYEAFRARHAIAAGLVVGYEGDGIDPGNNAYIRELAATRPWMATVAYVEPAAHPSSATVEALLDQGHIGLSVYVPDDAAASALSACDPAIWRTLSPRKAIVSFNIGLAHVGALTPIANAAPEAALLVSHMAMPPALAEPPEADATEAFLAPLLALSTTSNVMVKLSGFYAVSDPPHDYPHAVAAPLVRLLVERFGADRCLWGSDFSPSLDHVSFAQTIDVPGLADCDEAARTAVMGGNLFRLLERAKPA